MRIDPTQSTSPLRITSPVKSTAAPPKTSPASADSSHTLSFEGVYQNQLPRVPMTDAHRKLDRIRTQLVAGKTDVPIHFNSAPSPGRSGAANPYAAGYPRLISDPGEINTNLTAARTANDI